MTILYIFCAILVIFFGLVVFRGAPYVPSQKKYVKRAFESLYKIKESDTVLDIGSGGGVVLRIAAGFGAKAVGYELNPILVIISKILSARNSRVKVKFADFWLEKVPADTTLIYVFAVTRDIKKLSKKIQSECNRVQHSMHVISYGNEFIGKKPVKRLDAYYLYQFNPLH